MENRIPGAHSAPDILRRWPVVVGTGVRAATVIAVSTALVSVGLLTACGKSPTGPSSAPPPQPPTPANIDGAYTVRFDSTCAALPSDLRSRTYTAAITGSPQIVVTLTGANFWMHPTSGGLLNRFTGSVTGNFVSFNVRGPLDPLWGIVERIDSTRYLEIIGSGSGSTSGSTIEGRLDAGIGFGSDLRDDAQHVGCAAGSHALTLRFSRQ